MFQAEAVTATGDALDLGTSGAPGGLGGASLMGAATAVVRNGSNSGPIIAVLEAAVGKADHFTPRDAVAYRTKVHVTMVGTATLVLYKA
jgi:hypothetical protein